MSNLSGRIIRQIPYFGFVLVCLYLVVDTIIPVPSPAKYYYGIISELVIGMSCLIMYFNFKTVKEKKDYLLVQYAGYTFIFFGIFSILYFPKDLPLLKIAVAILLLILIILKKKESIGK